nr:squalene--hopene cyclase [Priestia taiwanensis]
MRKKISELQSIQRPNGSWDFCFEGPLMTDCLLITTWRTLNLKDEALIQKLVVRIAEKQQPNGYWKLYDDQEEGSLDATIQAYNALLFSGQYKQSDERMKKAEAYILAKGGLKRAHFMTKFMLALYGQYRWPLFLYFPMPMLVLPTYAPFNVYEFSNYARIHFVPMMVCANKKFTITSKWTPDLSYLNKKGREMDRFQETEYARSPIRTVLQSLKQLASVPYHIHQQGYQIAERFMLERLEPNGTLYSYASCSFYMIYALLALGYEKKSPVITRLLSGIKSLFYYDKTTIHLQNSPSTVWDTALLSYALQEAGVLAEEPMIKKATTYLLWKQQKEYGDWKVHSPNTAPGGWGFSDVNTRVPDVDDTTVAMRAIHRRALYSPPFRDAWQKGMNWLLAMQNDDGGWASFEKGANSKWLKLIPLDNAEDAIIDESSADLTGRALEMLGKHGGFTSKHPSVKRAITWLLQNQEKDGSWYGRWGVCYVYGTWAVVTGLRAVGVPATHPSLQKAMTWLLAKQRDNGGWGESCRSCEVKRFVPLAFSTPSQTAWAIDTLLVMEQEKEEHVTKGIRYLMKENYSSKEWEYPTGIGLPRQFYTYYHSYNYIFPLLALGHYQQKYNM